MSPFFLRADQSFKIGSTFKKENNEAYKSKGLDILGSIERDIGNKRIIGMGAKYDFEQVKKQDSSKNLMLLSVPILFHKINEIIYSILKRVGYIM